MQSHQFWIFTNAGKAAHWDDDLHDLQLSFGVAEFLVHVLFSNLNTECDSLLA